ncbi:Rrf2 family transcriptional regulator [Paenibacillus protaetiae]|uniref:Rrf2 family transcriptional regulator n=1 Tax=Paenibacillus protaetiae TaxID=2509456 RepID=A0A4P6EY71_9BACL|nr:Rrf2 family transcriptional regulator [Paenibacillus protaetiae]QAY66719.1 Rrf2 family transcriptional regulator [Paenibacillus protaetiae]
MSINTKLSVGIHILALLDTNKENVNTSEYMASSINTNPAVVRKITGLLRNAGMVEARPGVAGAKLAKPIAGITLLDVYRAVNPEHGTDLFSMHNNPNPDCLIGRHVQTSLESHFAAAQRALELELEKVTVGDIVHDIMAMEHDGSLSGS